MTTPTKFNQLSDRAKELACEAMAEAKDVSHLVRILDTSDDFRTEIDCLNHDIYPKVIDSIVRRFKDENKSYTL